MLIFAFIMTLLFGMTLGSIITIVTALYMSERAEMNRRMSIHPSTSHLFEDQPMIMHNEN